MAGVSTSSKKGGSRLRKILQVNEFCVPETITSGLAISSLQSIVKREY